MLLERAMLLFEEYRIKRGEEAKGKKKFLDLVAKSFPRHTDEYLKIERAFQETARTLEGRYRTGEEDAELCHPVAVAVLLMEHLEVRSPRRIVSALLHDNLEDFPKEWTFARIERDYGFDVAVNVWVVSKPRLATFGGDKESRDEFFREQLALGDREQKILKLSDRLHNLVTIWPKGDVKRTRKVGETRKFYIPRLAVPEQVLVEELEEACAFALTESDHMYD